MNTRSSLILSISLFFAVLTMGVFPVQAKPPSPEAPVPGPSLAWVRDEVILSESGNAERHQPEAAFNTKHNEWLVVWHTTYVGGTRDIWGRRVSQSGTPMGSPVRLATGFVSGDNKSRSNPAVAYDATNDLYMLVYMKEISADRYNLQARTVTWDLGVVNPEFQVWEYPDRSFWTPRIAWSQSLNGYMVVWNAFDTTVSFPPGVAYDLVAAKIFNNGTVTIVGVITASGAHQVDLAYNPGADRFLISYVVPMTHPAGNNIYALLLNPTGGVVNPPGLLTIDSRPGEQNAPSVAANGSNAFMVVYEDEYSYTDHDIFAKPVDSNGNLGSQIILNNSTLYDDYAPDVTGYGSTPSWVFTWMRKESALSAFSIQAATIYTHWEIAKYGLTDLQYPVVTYSPGGYLFAYEETNMCAFPKGDLSPETTCRDIAAKLGWPYAHFTPLVIK